MRKIHAKNGKPDSAPNNHKAAPKVERRQLITRIHPDLYERIGKVAEKEDRSVSYISEKLLEQGLEVREGRP